MKEKVSKLFKFLPLLILLYNSIGVYEFVEKYLADLAGIETEVGTVNADIAKDKKWLEGVKKFSENIDKAKMEIKDAEGQIEFVQRQLPSEVSDTEILEQLSKEAAYLNIRDFSIEPKDEVLNGFYFAKQYEFKGEGTYVQFLVFFERLGKAERIFNIRNMEIVPVKIKGSGRYKLIKLVSVIESFRYNTNYKPDAGVKEIEK